MHSDTEAFLKIYWSTYRADKTASALVIQCQSLGTGPQSIVVSPASHPNLHTDPRISGARRKQYSALMSVVNRAVGAGRGEGSYRPIITNVAIIACGARAGRVGATTTSPRLVGRESGRLTSG